MSPLRLRKALESDRGISLAELLVGFFISILLLTMIGGFFTSVVKGTQSSAVVDANTRSMSTALSTMVQYLHAATTYPVSGQTQPEPAFVGTPTATDVEFYAYVNLTNTAAQPVKVRFYRDPTTNHLIEQQWASTCSPSTGYCTFAVAVSKQLDLGGPVAATAPSSTNPSQSVGMFVYEDGTGAVTTTPSNIQFVQINFDWGSSAGRASGDGLVTTTVALLNLGQSGAQ
jgi:Tfp pilus assembly protein PilW